MTRYNVTFSDEQNEALKQAAETAGCPIPDLIRTSVWAYCPVAAVPVLTMDHGFSRVRVKYVEGYYFDRPDGDVDVFFEEDRGKFHGVKYAGGRTVDGASFRSIFERKEGSQDAPSKEFFPKLSGDYLLATANPVLGEVRIVNAQPDAVGWENTEALRRSKSSFIVTREAFDLFFELRV